MRRRAAFTAAALLAIAATGCTPEDPSETEDPMLTPPPADEALQDVGLSVPDAELTAEEGVHPSERSQEWSLRITFTADQVEVDAWIEDAFGSAEGLTVLEDGEPVSQRLRPEDVIAGSRSFLGSHPQDPSATYAVLVHPDGRTVIIAAAKTSR